MVPIAGKDYDLHLPQEYASVTQINMGLRCLKQYEFRYVEGLKIAPALPLAEGGSHHTALEANNLQRAKKGKSLAKKTMIDRFAEAFLGQEKEIADWQGENANSVIARGKGIIELYLQSPESATTPTLIGKDHGVEWAFGGINKHGKNKQKDQPSVLVAGVPMAGIIDLREAKEVTDYKVVAKSPSANAAEVSLQLMIYAAVTRTPKTSIVGLTKTKTPKVVKVEHKHDLKRSARWVAHVVSSIAKSISAGIFPCASPDNWACSPKFCGYWGRCRGASAQTKYFQVGGVKC